MRAFYNIIFKIFILFPLHEFVKDGIPVRVAREKAYSVRRKRDFAGYIIAAAVTPVHVYGERFALSVKIARMKMP